MSRPVPDRQCPDGIQNHTLAGLFPVIIAGIVVLAALLRYSAARDNLWFDELWTFRPEVVGKIRQPFDVFTAIRHENNHYLNTLVAWTLGPDRPAWWYRVPSILAGAASVWCAAQIGLRRSPIAGIFAAVLIGTSYLLVHYGSEARGYALAVCAALASWNFRERIVTAPRFPLAVLAAVSEILGMAAQPIFACYLAALFLVLLREQVVGDGLPRRQLVCQGGALAASGAFAAWLYLTDLSRAFNPGGNVIPWNEVASQSLSLLVGGPYEGPGRDTAAVVAVALLAGALWSLWRVERHWCLLAMLAGFIVPVGVVIYEARYELYPRYFLIGTALGLTSLALWLGRLWHQGGFSRGFAVVVLMVILGGQVRHIQRLWESGRGDSRILVDALLGETDGNNVVVTGDHEFRIRTLLGEGTGRFPADRKLRFIPDRDLTRERPDWLILHDFSIDPAWPREVRRGPVTWQFQQAVPYAGLSGWSTALYRRSNR